jgi:hypothetical protein
MWNEANSALNRKMSIDDDTIQGLQAGRTVGSESPFSFIAGGGYVFWRGRSRMLGAP